MFTGLAKLLRPKLRPTLYTRIEAEGELEDRLNSTDRTQSAEALLAYFQGYLKLGRKVYETVKVDLEKEHPEKQLVIVLAHETEDGQHHVWIIDHSLRYKDSELGDCIRKNYSGEPNTYLRRIGGENCGEGTHLLTPIFH